MGLLQDKKIAVVLALIVIIIGSIVYFTMDISKNDQVMNDEILESLGITNNYANNLSNTTNLPMMVNTALV